MNISTIQKKPSWPRIARALGIAAFLLALIVAGAFHTGTSTAQEVKGLPSLADLVERLQPSVVNVSSEAAVEVRRRGFPGMPGDPWDEFFRRFFENPPPGFQGGPEPTPRTRQNLGSGFIVDSKEGLVLTNNHVVEKATKITVTTQDQKEREATIVGRDPRTDLALLKIEIEDGEELPAVKLGDSSKLRVGDWVLAIGNPFGLAHTVTTGIVSAKGRVIGAGPYDDFIQTDASINPGNSGGPLFNLAGEVVGINTAIFSRTGGNIGIGFAIPVNMAKSIMPQLRKGSIVRGFLGVTIQPVTDAMAKALGLKEKKGVLVSSLVEDGPSAKAGIKRGDVIVSLNGKDAKDPRNLSRMAAGLRPGTKAKVVIIRDGKTQTINLTVGKLPDQTVVASKAPKQEMKKKLGIQGENLTPEIAQRIGAHASQGVVVTSVTPGSPAAKAGLHRGDVIIEANRKKVTGVDDLTKALQKKRENGNLLVVERRGVTQYIVVEGKG